MSVVRDNPPKLAASAGSRLPVRAPLLEVADSFGVAHMAQIYGAPMFALLPGGALGPIFPARIYDTLGSYQVAFTTFAVLNAASLALLCLVRSETRG